MVPATPEDSTGVVDIGKQNTSRGADGEHGDQFRPDPLGIGEMGIVDPLPADHCAQPRPKATLAQTGMNFVAAPAAIGTPSGRGVGVHIRVVVFFDEADDSAARCMSLPRLGAAAEGSVTV